MGEYGIDQGDDAEPVQSIIYVREEPPRLLWRSIVQGFGLAVGFFLAGILFWLSVVILVGLVLNQSLPSVPRL